MITTQHSQYSNEIAEALATAINDNFVSYEKTTTFIAHGEQQFAIFGTMAYELLCKRVHSKGTDSIVEYTPAIDAAGCATAQFPDEGRSGILHVMKFLRLNGKDLIDPKISVTYIECGWINESEISLTNAQIADNIANEIDAGATYITGGTAG